MTLGQGNILTTQSQELDGGGDRPLYDQLVALCLTSKPVLVDVSLALHHLGLVTSRNVAAVVV